MMKVNCSRSALENALGIITGVVSSRTPREALKCAQLVASKGQITLAGTDLEVSVRCTIAQVEIEEDGEVLLPAAKLGQIVHELSDEVVSVEANQESVHVRGQGSHFQIYGQNPEDFPPIPEFDGKPDLTIASSVIHRLIERTAFAAARENTRYAISGVLWERRGKKLQLVATDGRRLAKSFGSVKSTGDAELDVIVPSKTMSLLLRVIQADQDEEVAVRATPNQVLIHVQNVTVASVLVEGHFPKYEDVIPSDNKTKVTFNTVGLLSAVRRAALLTSDESKGIRLEFTSDALVLSSRAPQQGEATIRLPMQYDGGPLAIGFNPSFMVDALRVIEAEEVVLELNDASKPGVLTAGKDFVYVIMPVSLA